MRRLRFACVVAAAILGLSPAASGAGRKRRRPETVSFNVIQIGGGDGPKQFEAVGADRMKERYEEIMEEYRMLMDFWRQSRDLFVEDPANEGRKFGDLPPRKPLVKIVQSRIKGKAEAERAASVLRRSVRRRVESVPYCVVVITDIDGHTYLEAIESGRLKLRQKDIMEEYQALMKLWRKAEALFRKDPENAGEEYGDPPPRRPKLRPLQAGLEGYKAATEALKVLDEKWLQPRLEKRRAKEEKRAR